MTADGGTDVASSPTDLFAPVQALLRGSKTLRDIEVLLDKGANPDEWKGPLTPVRCAVQARNTRLLSLLLKKGANCDAKDSKGVSALHIAVFDNKSDCARLLLDARADVNSLDRHGQSPLFFAPTRQICELLISRKADTTIKNNKSQSALHLAAHAGLNETVACLAKVTGKKILESQDHRGHTPLFYAAHSRMKTTLSVLQKQGAELKVREPRDRPRSAQSENPSTTLDETDFGVPNQPLAPPDVAPSPTTERPATPASLGPTGAEDALPGEPAPHDAGGSPQGAQSDAPVQGAEVHTPEGSSGSKPELEATPPKERGAQRRSTPPTVEVEDSKVSSPVASFGPLAAASGLTPPATPAEQQQQQQQQQHEAGVAEAVAADMQEAGAPEQPADAWSPAEEAPAEEGDPPAPAADEQAVAPRPQSAAVSTDAATSAVPEAEEAAPPSALLGQEDAAATGHGPAPGEAAPPAAVPGQEEAAAMGHGPAPGEAAPPAAMPGQEDAAATGHGPAPGEVRPTAVVETPTVAATKGADVQADGTATVAVAAQDAPAAWEASGGYGVPGAAVEAAAPQPRAQAAGPAEQAAGGSRGAHEAATPPVLPPSGESLRAGQQTAAADREPLERSPSTGSLGSLAENSPPPARPVERFEKDGCLYWEVTLSKETTNDKYGFVQANGKIEFETRAASNLRVTSERGDVEAVAKPSGPLLIGPESLIVRRIHNEGLMERWNKRHKECEVYTQDRIVQVNDALTVESMQREFRERRKVIMKVARYPERFAVMLRKSGSKSKLGFRFERPQQLSATGATGTPGTEVRISEVMEDGLLMDHNRHQVALGNWHYVVLPDMRIEAANRAMGDALLIAQELKDSKEVTLTVRRAEQAMLSQQQVRQRLQKLAMAQVAQQQLTQLQMRQREEGWGQPGTGSGTEGNGEQHGHSSAESGTDDERRGRGRGSSVRGSSNGPGNRFHAAAKAASSREDSQPPKPPTGSK